MKLRAMLRDEAGDGATGGGESKDETPPEKSAELLAAEARIAELESAAKAIEPLAEAGRNAKAEAVMASMDRDKVRPECVAAFEAVIRGKAAELKIDIATADAEALARLRTETAKAIRPLLNIGKAAGAAGTGPVGTTGDSGAPIHPLLRLPRGF